MSGVMLAAGLWPRSAHGFVIGYGSGTAHRELVVYPIPASDGAMIDRDAQLILVRYQESVFAFARTCPHQNTALRWRENEMRFRCPKHDSRYQPDGRFIDGRATRGMDRFAVSREGGNVVVDTSRLFKEDDDPAGWEAARVDL
jgi:Rieske Fe-S protein